MISFEQLIDNNNFETPSTGDVLLVESKGGFLDRVIKFIGRSQFTHTAMLIDIKGTWFVVESRPRYQQHEYQIMPVDWWMERNKGKDTYLGKMPTKGSDSHIEKKDIETKIKSTILNPKWSIRPYKIMWCALVVILQLLGIKRPSIKKYRDESKHPMICSTIVQEAWENAGVIERGNFKSPGNIAELTGGLHFISGTQEEKQNSKFRQHNYTVSNFSVINIG